MASQGKITLCWSQCCLKSMDIDNGGPYSAIRNGIWMERRWLVRWMDASVQARLPPKDETDFGVQEPQMAGVAKP